MGYEELLPNLKWNACPHTNKNIVVICHPTQINYYLPSIKEYIWTKISKVTIWQTKNRIDNVELLEEEISNMDVVICLVSELLIGTNNVIIDSVIPKIINREINFIPCAVEGNNIEIRFNNKFENIHIIKGKNLTDLYEKICDYLIPRLNNYSDNRIAYNNYNLIKKYNTSFFISYRKKDGKYIENIQNKIHEDKRLLGVQLWYDAYLMPGKNYDNSLRFVIEQSELVILIVTPNLLEKDNYVMDIEIPFAKRCGKKIIPIMFENVDDDTFLRHYKIENIYNLSEWNSFSDILLNEGIELENDIFYPYLLREIANEYIKGTLFEKNYDIAIELLQQALEYGYMDAYIDLIEIKSGKFDAYYNFEETISLYDKYTKYLKDNFIINKDKKNFTKMLDYLRKYSEFYMCHKQFIEAESKLLELYDYIKDIEKKGDIQLMTYLSTCCLLLGKNYNNMKKYNSAEFYLRKSMKIDYDIYNGEIDNGNSITFINCLTSLCELGEFYLSLNRIQKAKIMYLEILSLIKSTGTFYVFEDTIRKGSENEYVAKNIRNLMHYAMTGIERIEVIENLYGVYNPNISKKGCYYLGDYGIDKKKCYNYIISHEFIINSIEKMVYFIRYINILKDDSEIQIKQQGVCITPTCLHDIIRIDPLDSCEILIYTDDLKKLNEALRKMVEALS